MFKRIKDKFKQRSGAKFLREELKKPLATTARKNGIVKLGCLVNLDQFENANLFQEFIEEFSLRPNAVKIIGYKSFYDKNSPYSTPVFSDKDLGWGGTIENSVLVLKKLMSD